MADVEASYFCQRSSHDFSVVQYEAQALYRLRYPVSTYEVQGRI